MPSRRKRPDRLRSGLRFAAPFGAALLLVSLCPPCCIPAHAGILADFESGAATLVSHDPAEDLQPDGWQITPANAYGGSQYALRLSGNTWKAQFIPPLAIGTEAVFQVAVYVEEIGETQAFGVSDGTNTLYYTVAGTQLFSGDPWQVAYQGAFATGAWHLYLLPIGRDWNTRYGYAPVLDRLVYVNDRDNTTRGAVVFDEIADVTADLPVAPSVEIVVGARKAAPPSRGPLKVGVQFHAQVDDPDSDTFLYAWDFGDSAFSADPDPYHEFVVRADHAYTVGLAVRDDTGLWGRDSAQVSVEAGGGGARLSMNFAGDVMLARNYDTPGGLIDQHGPEYVFVPTRPVYGDDADVNVCNLECPLTDEGTPHPTKSYVFRGRPANVAGLTYAGIDVVSLGNNHIVDYGQRGMEETQEVLDAAGIRWSGAGDDEYAALQPIFWTERGVAVAFLGQCNRTGREYNYQPFLDAAPGKPGFAYLIEPNLGDAVAAARPYADLVVAQLHAGIEYATAPALRGGAPEAAAPVPEPPFDAASVEPGEPGPEFTTMPSYTDRQLCRRAVDAGADLVIGHHPHVLQGFEVYGGVLIAFSLGNFAFDQSFAETFPSIVLRAEFDKDGFRTFTFRPVFIDDMVPRPATGRLGREILDRQAEYSRALGAVVSTDPGAMKATIHLEPAGVSWTPSVWSRAEVPVERDGWWVTPPIERTGDGTLSRILSLEGAAGAQVRIGREILWHGDFEDEGATMWNLNSVDEVYDEDFPRQGARSLRQHRTPANSGPVTTDLQGYPPLLDVLDHSLMGWIRTENAADARITARVFTGRGGTVLGAYDAGAALSGTNGWTWRWSDFRAPSGAKYFNVRPQMERPGAGDAFAWYDEVRLVAWDAWQDASLPLDVPWPGNARFLQVRATAPADTFRIGWEERTREDPLATAGNAGGRPFPGLADLRAPSPNPFGASTWIEYRLSGRARVRLDVFDVTGRRVARLVDEERPEGAHRVSWDGRSAASGLYFVRLEAAGAVRTRKVIVLR